MTSRLAHITNHFFHIPPTQDEVGSRNVGAAPELGSSTSPQSGESHLRSGSAFGSIAPAALQRRSGVGAGNSSARYVGPVRAASFATSTAVATPVMSPASPLSSTTSRWPAYPLSSLASGSLRNRAPFEKVRCTSEGGRCPSPSSPLGLGPSCAAETFPSDAGRPPSALGWSSDTRSWLASARRGIRRGSAGVAAVMLRDTRSMTARSGASPNGFPAPGVVGGADPHGTAWTSLPSLQRQPAAGRSTPALSAADESCSEAGGEEDDGQPSRSDVTEPPAALLTEADGDMLAPPLLHYVEDEEVLQYVAAHLRFRRLKEIISDGKSADAADVDVQCSWGGGTPNKVVALHRDAILHVGSSKSLMMRVRRDRDVGWAAAHTSNTSTTACAARRTAYSSREAGGGDAHEGTACTATPSCLGDPIRGAPFRNSEGNDGVTDVLAAATQTSPHHTADGAGVLTLSVAAAAFSPYVAALGGASLVAGEGCSCGCGGGPSMGHTSAGVQHAAKERCRDDVERDVQQLHDGCAASPASPSKTCTGRAAAPTAAAKTLPSDAWANALGGPDAALTGHTSETPIHLCLQHSIFANYRTLPTCCARRSYEQLPASYRAGLDAISAEVAAQQLRRGPLSNAERAGLDDEAMMQGSDRSDPCAPADAKDDELSTVGSADDVWAPTVPSIPATANDNLEVSVSPISFLGMGYVSGTAGAAFGAVPPFACASGVIDRSNWPAVNYRPSSTAPASQTTTPRMSPGGVGLRGNGVLDWPVNPLLNSGAMDEARCVTSGPLTMAFSTRNLSAGGASPPLPPLLLSTNSKMLTTTAPNADAAIRPGVVPMLDVLQTVQTFIARGEREVALHFIIAVAPYRFPGMRDSGRVLALFNQVRLFLRSPRLTTVMLAMEALRVLYRPDVGASNADCAHMTLELLALTEAYLCHGCTYGEYVSGLLMLRAVLAFAMVGSPLRRRTPEVLLQHCSVLRERLPTFLLAVWTILMEDYTIDDTPRPPRRVLRDLAANALQDAFTVALELQMTLPVQNVVANAVNVLVAGPPKPPTSSPSTPSPSPFPVPAAALERGMTPTLDRAVAPPISLGARSCDDRSARAATPAAILVRRTADFPRRKTQATTTFTAAPPSTTCTHGSTLAPSSAEGPPAAGGDGGGGGPLTLPAVATATSPSFSTSFPPNSTEGNRLSPSNATNLRSATASPPAQLPERATPKSLWHAVKRAAQRLVRLPSAAERRSSSFGSSSLLRGRHTRCGSSCMDGEDVGTPSLESEPLRHSAPLMRGACVRAPPSGPLIIEVPEEVLRNVVEVDTFEYLEATVSHADSQRADEPGWGAADTTAPRCERNDANSPQPDHPGSTSVAFPASQQRSSPAAQLAQRRQTVHDTNASLKPSSGIRHPRTSRSGTGVPAAAVCSLSSPTEGGDTKEWSPCGVSTPASREVLWTLPMTRALRAVGRKKTWETNVAAATLTIGAFLCAWRIAGRPSAQPMDRAIGEALRQLRRSTATDIPERRLQSSTSPSEGLLEEALPLLTGEFVCSASSFAYATRQPDEQRSAALFSSLEPGDRGGSSRAEQETAGTAPTVDSGSFTALLNANLDDHLQGSAAAQTTSTNVTGMPLPAFRTRLESPGKADPEWGNLERVSTNVCMPPGVTSTTARTGEGAATVRAAAKAAASTAAPHTELPPPPPPVVSPSSPAAAATLVAAAAATAAATDSIPTLEFFLPSWVVSRVMALCVCPPWAAKLQDTPEAMAPKGVNHDDGDKQRPATSLQAEQLAVTAETAVLLTSLVPLLSHFYMDSLTASEVVTAMQVLVNRAIQAVRSLSQVAGHADQLPYREAASSAASAEHSKTNRAAAKLSHTTKAAAADAAVMTEDAARRTTASSASAPIHPAPAAFPDTVTSSALLLPCHVAGPYEDSALVDGTELLNAVLYVVTVADRYPALFEAVVRQRLYPLLHHAILLGSAGAAGQLWISEPLSSATVAVHLDAVARTTFTPSLGPPLHQYTCSTSHPCCSGLEGESSLQQLRLTASRALYERLAMPALVLLVHNMPNEACAQRCYTVVERLTRMGTRRPYSITSVITASCISAVYPPLSRMCQSEIVRSMGVSLSAPVEELCDAENNARFPADAAAMPNEVSAGEGSKAPRRWPQGRWQLHRGDQHMQPEEGLLSPSSPSSHRGRTAPSSCTAIHAPVPQMPQPSTHLVSPTVADRHDVPPHPVTSLRAAQIRRRAVQVRLTQHHCFRVMRLIFSRWEGAGLFFLEVCLPYLRHPDAQLRLECVQCCMRWLLSDCWHSVGQTATDRVIASMRSLSANEGLRSGLGEAPPSTSSLTSISSPSAISILCGGSVSAAVTRAPTRDVRTTAASGRINDVHQAVAASTTSSSSAALRCRTVFGTRSEGPARPTRWAVGRSALLAIVGGRGRGTLSLYEAPVAAATPFTRVTPPLPAISTSLSTPYTVQHHGCTHTNTLREAVHHLVELAVCDPEPLIRQSALDSLSVETYPFLYTHESILNHLFVALWDGYLPNRVKAVRLLCALAPFNPAALYPRLRQVLVLYTRDLTLGMTQRSYASGNQPQQLGAGAVSPAPVRQLSAPRVVHEGALAVLSELSSSLTLTTHLYLPQILSIVAHVLHCAASSRGSVLQALRLLVTLRENTTEEQSTLFAPLLKMVAQQLVEGDGDVVRLLASVKALQSLLQQSSDLTLLSTRTLPTVVERLHSLLYRKPSVTTEFAMAVLRLLSTIGSIEPLDTEAPAQASVLLRKPQSRYALAPLSFTAGFLGCAQRAHVQWLDQNEPEGCAAEALELLQRADRFAPFTVDAWCDPILSALMRTASGFMNGTRYLTQDGLCACLAAIMNILTNTMAIAHLEVYFPTVFTLVIDLCKDRQTHMLRGEARASGGGDAASSVAHRSRGRNMTQSEAGTSGDALTAAAHRRSFYSASHSGDGYGAAEFSECVRLQFLEGLLDLVVKAGRHIALVYPLVSMFLRRSWVTMRWRGLDYCCRILEVLCTTVPDLLRDDSSVWVSSLLESLMLYDAMVVTHQRAGEMHSRSSPMAAHSFTAETRSLRSGETAVGAAAEVRSTMSHASARAAGETANTTLRGLGSPSTCGPLPVHPRPAPVEASPSALAATTTAAAAATYAEGEKRVPWEVQLKRIYLAITSCLTSFQPLTSLMARRQVALSLSECVKSSYVPQEANARHRPAPCPASSTSAAVERAPVDIEVAVAPHGEGTPFTTEAAMFDLMADPHEELISFVNRCVCQTLLVYMLHSNLNTVSMKLAKNILSRLESLSTVHEEALRRACLIMGGGDSDLARSPQEKAALLAWLSGANADGTAGPDAKVQSLPSAVRTRLEARLRVLREQPCFLRLHPDEDTPSPPLPLDGHCIFTASRSVSESVWFEDAALSQMWVQSTDKAALVRRHFPFNAVHTSWETEGEVHLFGCLLVSVAWRHPPSTAAYKGTLYAYVAQRFGPDNLALNYVRCVCSSYYDLCMPVVSARAEQELATNWAEPELHRTPSPMLGNGSADAPCEHGRGSTRTSPASTSPTPLPAEDSSVFCGICEERTSLLSADVIFRPKSALTFATAPTSSLVGQSRMGSREGGGGADSCGRGHSDGSSGLHAVTANRLGQIDTDPEQGGEPQQTPCRRVLPSVSVTHRTSAGNAAFSSPMLAFPSREGVSTGSERQRPTDFSDTECFHDKGDSVEGRSSGRAGVPGSECDSAFTPTGTLARGGRGCGPLATTPGDSSRRSVGTEFRGSRGSSTVPPHECVSESSNYSGADTIHTRFSGIGNTDDASLFLGDTFAEGLLPGAQTESTPLTNEHPCGSPRSSQSHQPVAYFASKEPGKAIRPTETLRSSGQCYLTSVPASNIGEDQTVSHRAMMPLSDVGALPSLTPTATSTSRSALPRQRGPLTQESVPLCACAPARAVASPLPLGTMAEKRPGRRPERGPDSRRTFLANPAVLQVGLREEAAITLVHDAALASQPCQAGTVTSSAARGVEGGDTYPAICADDVASSGVEASAALQCATVEQSDMVDAATNTPNSPVGRRTRSVSTASSSTSEVDLVHQCHLLHFFTTHRFLSNVDDWRQWWERFCLLVLQCSPDYGIRACVPFVRQHYIALSYTELLPLALLSTLPTCQMSELKAWLQALRSFHALHGGASNPVPQQVASGVASIAHGIRLYRKAFFPPRVVSQVVDVGLPDRVVADLAARSLDPPLRIHYLERDLEQCFTWEGIAQLMVAVDDVVSSSVRRLFLRDARLRQLLHSAKGAGTWLTEEVDDGIIGETSATRDPLRHIESAEQLPPSMSEPPKPRRKSANARASSSIGVETISAAEVDVRSPWTLEVLGLHWAAAQAYVQVYAGHLEEHGCDHHPREDPVNGAPSTSAAAREARRPPTIGKTSALVGAMRCYVNLFDFEAVLRLWATTRDSGATRGEDHGGGSGAACSVTPAPTSTGESLWELKREAAPFVMISAHALSRWDYVREAAPYAFGGADVTGSTLHASPLTSAKNADISGSQDLLRPYVVPDRRTAGWPMSEDVASGSPDDVTASLPSPSAGTGTTPTMAHASNTLQQQQTAVILGAELVVAHDFEGARRALQPVRQGLRDSYAVFHTNNHRVKLEWCSVFQQLSDLEEGMGVLEQGPSLEPETAATAASMLAESRSGAASVTWSGPGSLTLDREINGRLYPEVTVRRLRNIACRAVPPSATVLQRFMAIAVRRAIAPVSWQLDNLIALGEQLEKSGLPMRAVWELHQYSLLPLGLTSANAAAVEFQQQLNLEVLRRCIRNMFLETDLREVFMYAQMLLRQDLWQTRCATARWMGAASSGAVSVPSTAGAWSPQMSCAMDGAPPKGSALTVQELGSSLSSYQVDLLLLNVACRRRLAHVMLHRASADHTTTAVHVSQSDVRTVSAAAASSPTATTMKAGEAAVARLRPAHTLAVPLLMSSHGSAYPEDNSVFATFPHTPLSPSIARQLSALVASPSGSSGHLPSRPHSICTGREGNAAGSDTTHLAASGVPPQEGDTIVQTMAQPMASTTRRKQADQRAEIEDEEEASLQSLESLTGETALFTEYYLLEHAFTVTHHVPSLWREFGLVLFDICMAIHAEWKTTGDEETKLNFLTQSAKAIHGLQLAAQLWRSKSEATLNRGIGPFPATMLHRHGHTRTALPSVHLLVKALHLALTCEAIVGQHERLVVEPATTKVTGRSHAADVPGAIPPASASPIMDFASPLLKEDAAGTPAATGPRERGAWLNPISSSAPAPVASKDDVLKQASPHDEPPLKTVANPSGAGHTDEARSTVAAPPAPHRPSSSLSELDAGKPSSSSHFPRGGIQCLDFSPASYVQWAGIAPFLLASAARHPQLYAALRQMCTGSFDLLRQLVFPIIANFEHDDGTLFAQRFGQEQRRGEAELVEIPGALLPSDNENDVVMPCVEQQDGVCTSRELPFRQCDADIEEDSSASDADGGAGGSFPSPDPSLSPPSRRLPTRQYSEAVSERSMQSILLRDAAAASPAHRHLIEDAMQLRAFVTRFWNEARRRTDREGTPQSQREHTVAEEGDDEVSCFAGPDNRGTNALSPLWETEDNDGTTSVMERVGGRPMKSGREDMARMNEVALTAASGASGGVTELTLGGFCSLPAPLWRLPVVFNLGRAPAETGGNGVHPEEKYGGSTGDGVASQTAGTRRFSADGGRSDISEVERHRSRSPDDISYGAATNDIHAAEHHRTNGRGKRGDTADPPDFTDRGPAVPPAAHTDASRYARRKACGTGGFTAVPFTPATVPTILHARRCLVPQRPASPYPREEEVVVLLMLSDGMTSRFMHASPVTLTEADVRRWSCTASSNDASSASREEPTCLPALSNCTVDGAGVSYVPPISLMEQTMSLLLAYLPLSHLQRPFVLPLTVRDYMTVLPEVGGGSSLQLGATAAAAVWSEDPRGWRRETPFLSTANGGDGTAMALRMASQLLGISSHPTRSLPSLCNLADDYTAHLRVQEIGQAAQEAVEAYPARHRDAMQVAAESGRSPGLSADTVFPFNSVYGYAASAPPGDEATATLLSSSLYRNVAQRRSCREAEFDRLVAAAYDDGALGPLLSAIRSLLASRPSGGLPPPPLSSLPPSLPLARSEMDAFGASPVANRTDTTPNSSFAASAVALSSLTMSTSSAAEETFAHQQRLYAYAASLPRTEAHLREMEAVLSAVESSNPPPFAEAPGELFESTSSAAPLLSEVSGSLSPCRRQACRLALMRLESRRFRLALSDAFSADSGNASYWLETRRAYAKELSEWSVMQYLLDTQARECRHFMVNTYDGHVAVHALGRYSLQTAPPSSSAVLGMAATPLAADGATTTPDKRDVDLLLTSPFPTHDATLFRLTPVLVAGLPLQSPYNLFQFNASAMLYEVFQYVRDLTGILTYGVDRLTAFSYGAFPRASQKPLLPSRPPAGDAVSRSPPSAVFCDLGNRDSGGGNSSNAALADAGKRPKMVTEAGALSADTEAWGSESNPVHPESTSEPSTALETAVTIMRGGVSTGSRTCTVSPTKSELSGVLRESTNLRAATSDRTLPTPAANVNTTTFSTRRRHSMKESMRADAPLWPAPRDVALPPPPRCFDTTSLRLKLSYDALLVLHDGAEQKGRNSMLKLLRRQRLETEARWGQPPSQTSQRTPEDDSFAVVKEKKVEEDEEKGRAAAAASLQQRLKQDSSTGTFPGPFHQDAMLDAATPLNDRKPAGGPSSAFDLVARMIAAAMNEVNLTGSDGLSPHPWQRWAPHW